MSGSLDVLQLVYGGRGGQTAVAAGIAAGLRDAGLRSGIVLHALPGDVDRGHTLDASADEVVVVPRRRRLDPTADGRLYRALVAHPARILIAHIPYGSRAIRRAKRARLLTAAVLVEHHSLARRRRRDDVRSSRMLGACDGLVLLSEAYRDGYPLARRAARLGLPQAVIPNGVDPDVFRPAPGSVQSSRQRSVRFGMVSGLVPGKDHASLLRAMVRLHATEPGAHLTIIGDGPRRGSLEALRDELGLGSVVTFVGHVPSSEVAARLRDLDVYVHASSGETHSTAILQAQATALPVIGSRVPGVAEAVAEGIDGLLVEAGDVDGLASAMRRFVGDEDLAARLGAAGRRRVLDGSTTASMVEGYLALLRRVDARGPWEAAGSDPTAP